MPKNPTWALGKSRRSITKTDKFIETYPTIHEISRDTKIKVPECQHSLDEMKVHSMAEEFRKNPLTFRNKDTITIGVLNNTPYLVDGQHRFHMCKHLAEQYGVVDSKCTNQTFRFCYTTVDSENELRDLFKSVNHDSEKNQWYITQDDMVNIKMDECSKLFRENYKKAFANKITPNPYKYTIREFVEELGQKRFFQTDKNAAELVNEIQKFNDQFFDSYYAKEVQHNDSSFHKTDLDHIVKSGRQIFTLIRNNFIDMITGNEDHFVHTRKRAKKGIPRKIRLQCWEARYTGCAEAECPIPNCSAKLCKNDSSSWHAGHVNSEKNGGATSVENLRPICPPCNLAMGAQNWHDYISDTGTRTVTL